MDAATNLVRQIIANAGITSPARRREVTIELRSHIEDLMDEARAGGHDDADIETIVYQRFGQPEEIARAFANTYRVERIVTNACTLAALVVASLLAVGGVISAVQLCVAIWSGGPLAVFFHGMRSEIVGFLALTWGYVGTYLWERVCRRLVVSVAVNMALFIPVVLGLHYLSPGHVTAPAVAFAGAGMVRVFQHADGRLIWCAGTAAPLLGAWLVLGPFVGGDWALASWKVGLLVWLGMTLSCVAMTSLAKLFDQRVYARWRLAPETALSL